MEGSQAVRGVAGVFTPALRFKLAFGLLFAAFGAFYPYLALYLQTVGLSGGQIGVILGTMPLLGFVAQPVWGVVSDVYRLRRTALIVACFGVAISSWLYSVTDSFPVLFALTVTLSVSRSPIGPLCDALALEHLESTSHLEDYGGLRLWGSVGFSISSLLVGAFVIGEHVEYIVVLYSLIMVGLGVLAFTLPDARVTTAVTWIEGMSLLKRNPALMKFFLGILLIGMTVGVVHQYLIVYLQQIHAPGWVSGVAFSLSALFEVPLMANSARLIGRWGLRLVLLVGIAVLPLRWLLYTVITEPVLVIPTQVLHSMAMMSLLVAGVLYVDKQLERKWRATGQALYQATLQGLGSSIGLFAAGLIYGYFGIVPVWWACVGTGLVGLLVVAGTVRLQDQGDHGGSPLKEGAQV